MKDHVRNESILFVFVAALIALMWIALMWIGTGCGPKQTAGPVDGTDILATTDRLYTDIKIVVTDPEVRPLFSDEDMAAMAEMERKYLDATATLRTAPDDADAIQVIAGVATDILTVINGVEFTEKYRPMVAAIRISINIMRSHLGG